MGDGLQLDFSKAQPLPGTGGAVALDFSKAQPIAGTSSSSSPTSSRTMAVANPKGLIEPGNLPIWNRPTVQNADGTHSSEYSTSFADDQGREVLVPTIVNGRFLTADGKKPQQGSPQEKAMFQRAWQHYLKTGEHLGKFDNPDNADAYSDMLHNRGQAAAAKPDLTANPNREGIYRMKGPDGREVGIPYSNAAGSAIHAGYQFSDDAERSRFIKDYSADPKVIARAADIARQNPGTQAGIGFGKGAAATVTGLGAIAHVPGAAEANKQVTEPSQSPEEAAGNLGESAAEFFSGEELLGLIGKGFKSVEALKGATQLAGTLEKYPAIAKLLRIGMNATKAGTVAGAQTLAKTGGDVGAATEAGLETGGAGAAIEAAAPVLKAGAKKLLPKIEAAKPGAAEFGAEARAAAKPTIEKINATRGEPQIKWETGPGGVQGEPAGMTTPAPKIDVDATLNRIHDFTGAADRLAEVSDAGYKHLDTLTDGKFSKLNSEVSAAQKAAWRGTPDDVGAYVEKQNEMEDLLNSVEGVKPEEVQALKNSWRQSYQLRDVGGIWDRNLNGVPGSTQASQAQRGVNGKGLMTDLQRAVKIYGRPTLEKSLGPGRLENLEAIAQANQTIPQRKAFNQALHVATRYLPVLVGAHLGREAGGIGGEAIGMAAAAYAKPAMERVLNAVKANPQIGQNLIYAIEGGARPENYGPIIGSMIQRSEIEAAREQKKGNQP